MMMMMMRQYATTRTDIMYTYAQFMSLCKVPA